MDKRNIIVIGASAGGFEAIKTIISGLSPDLQAAILIVWHISPDVRGILPQVLSRQTKLQVSHAANGEPVKNGRVYIAPPDHHLILEDDHVRITKGPKENRFRPAVDPLFRSAAFVYGRRVIGVILSGALDDGSAGLWTIKQYGGMVVVQEPDEAEVPSMPESAIRAVQPDYVARVAQIPAILEKLVSEDLPAEQNGPQKADPLTYKELHIAMEDQSLKYDVFKMGTLTPYTCPECHGVLTALHEGDRIRFRCHTGHAFSADTLLASISETIEESLWNAIRNIQESIFLLNHMGDHFAEVNQPKLAALYFKKAKEAEKRSAMVRDAVLSHEQLTTQGMQHEIDEEEKNK